MKNWKLVGIQVGHFGAYTFPAKIPEIVHSEMEGEHYDLFEEMFCHSWSKKLVNWLNDTPMQVATKLLIKQT